MRKLTGDHNQCQACFEYFNSTHSFDAHRTGPYGNHKRRCLSPSEMIELGMGLNKGDWWITNAGKHPNSSPLVQQNSGATDSRLPT
jgi:hypothetical protein